MEKIVITGSSGRIGRALHWKLSQDYSVKGIDISPSTATSKLVDIRNFDQLLRNFEGVATVYHSAALHAPHVGIASEKDFYETNVHATEKICKAAQQTGVSQIIFTSTTALYGYANYGNGKAVWIDEKTKPEPKTIYHKTKVEAENLMKEYASKNLAISVIRMSRCFPEPAQLMAVYRLHRGIDYRDVAEAHQLAAERKKDQFFDCFIISGETPFMRTDCQMLYENPEAVICERFPVLAKEFEGRGWKFPASIDRVYDSNYAQQKLNWKSKRGATEVIRQFENNEFEVLPPT